MISVISVPPTATVESIAQPAADTEHHAERLDGRLPDDPPRVSEIVRRRVLSVAAIGLFSPRAMCAHPWPGPAYHPETTGRPLRCIRNYTAIMRTLYVVDAFTRTPLTGNPAGVVLDAEGLTDEQMLAVARELRHSETAFVLPADGVDHDVRVRFFTPTAEVPTCGHATVAAHYARAIEHDLAAPVDLVQKTGGGILQPIHIGHDGGDLRIGMHQGVAHFERILDSKELQRLLAALGVAADALMDDCPVQIVSTGHSKVLVPLRSRQTLDGLVPDLHALAVLSGDIGCNGYFTFTLDTNDAAVLTHSRMFAPAIGIPEDPVTGNGHGPLGAYLHHHGLLVSDQLHSRFVGRQGVAMGRPGEVDVTVICRPDGTFAVDISGRAVTVYRAELRL